MCLTEKIYVLDKLCLGMSYRIVECEFNVNESTTYVLNEVSLNKNIDKTKSSIHQLMKMWPETLRSTTMISLKGNGSIFTNSLFIGTLQNITVANNENCILINRQKNVIKPSKNVATNPVYTPTYTQ